MIVSINQLMDITGQSFRTIKKRLETLSPDSEDGRSIFYDSHKAMPLLYANENSRSTENQLGKESLLLERAKREKAEIEVQKLKGEVVFIEEVAKVVEKEYTYVRAQLRSIPSKLAKPLSMLTDPHMVHERLQEAVDECLTELAADKHYEEQRINAQQSLKEVGGEPSESVEANTEVEPGSMG